MNQITDDFVDRLDLGVSCGLHNVVWELGRRIGEPSLGHAHGTADGRTRANARIERLLSKLGDMFDVLGDRWGLASCLYVLGNLAFLRGDYNRARVYYERSAEEFATVGDRAQQGRVCHQLGIVAQKLSDLPLARDWYGRALTFAVDLGDHAAIARTCHQLGNIAYLCGDSAEARACYENALDVAQESKDLAGISRASYQLGLLAQGVGERRKAEVYYDRASSAAKTLGDVVTVRLCRDQRRRLMAEAEAAVAADLEAISIEAV